MQIDLTKFLEAVGPNASLIFASWIFLSFLQSRYSDAYDRYRSLVQEVREHGHNDNEHQSSVKDQVALYKHRCEQMRVATNIGVIPAMLLIVAILVGGLHVIFDANVLTYICVGAAIMGLALVIVAAAFVLRENTLIQHAIDGEVADQRGRLAQRGGH
jgi:hypothetical protein